MFRRWHLVMGIWFLMIGLAACSLPASTPAPALTTTLLPTSNAATIPPAELINGTLLPSTGVPNETLTLSASEVPVATPELGQEGNPILLALPPAQILSSDVIANGQALATMLQEQTGYRVVAVAPSSATDMIEALRAGNAHIAGLSPYEIAKAYEQGAVVAAYASTKDKSASYGAQFLARSDQFTSFFDPNAGRNFKDPPEALMQFSGKKPCWTTNDSLSGYRVPAGILGWYKIPVQEGAFLQSHYSVVRAIELGGVCDFGATYIDARAFPALKDQFPHLMDEVVVTWQIPAVIPYNGIFYSTTLPADMVTKLNAAFQQISVDSQGQTLLKSLYDVSDVIPVQDDFYTQFVRYINSSGADWETLVH